MYLMDFVWDITLLMTYLYKIGTYVDKSSIQYFLGSSFWSTNIT